MSPPAGVELCRSSFEVLRDWGAADLSSAWPAWQAAARALVAGRPPLRPAQAADGDLLRLMEAVAAMPDHVSSTELRQFVEHRCDPFEVAAPGFLTGYYEPVVTGSRHRTPDFRAPILPRPADLVTFAPGQTGPGLPDGLAAARRRADSGLEAYADRADLEDWAVGPAARPLVWLRDWTEVFLIHVQGSARVRLEDGSEHRLVYAGRNGHAYTSIGRLLAETGEIAWAEMSLDRLKGWIRAHGQEVGEAGRTLMQRNRSYIFFEMIASDGASGPIGGAGLPLLPGVSIAVDRTVWPYGLPFWIATDAPVPGFGAEPLARLFIAQDTGSAIVGPGRVDLFLGSGDAAGSAAGHIRHAARITVLKPKAS